MTIFFPLQTGLKNIENKIKEIEKDLSDNQNTIDAIRDSIRDIAGGNGKIGAEKLQSVIDKLKPGEDQLSHRIQNVKHVNKVFIGLGQIKLFPVM